MAIYNIHGGHNPSGKIACGASDLLDESREDRKICKAGFILQHRLKKS